MPRVNNNQFKTFFLKMYDDAQAWKGSEFPTKEITLENIEKVIFTGKIPVYYLEGNDLVFHEISTISIDQDGTIVTVNAS